jgi:hypothetical protein
MRIGHAFPWGELVMWYRLQNGRIRSCRIETNRQDAIQVDSLQEELSDVLALGSTMAEAVKKTVDDPQICDDLTKWLEREMHL